MLKQRIITAVVLLVVIALALFVLPSPFMFAFLVIMLAVAAWEWAKMLKLSSANMQYYIVAAVVGIFIVLQYLPLSIVKIYLSIACLAWLGLFYFLLKHQLNDNLKIYAVFLLLPAAGIALWQLYLVSPFWMLAGCLIVWIADTAAYFSGRKFGKNKLAPSISPGKTWEGFYGAVAGVLIYGIIIYLAFLSGNFIVWLLLLAALTAVSVLGDLFESQLKRDAGIKDSGTILPGHGGVLDRIDSLITVAPFFALLATGFIQ